MRRNRWLASGLVLLVPAGFLAFVLAGLPFQYTWGGLDFLLLLELVALLGAGLVLYGVWVGMRAGARKPDSKADAQIIFRAMLSLAEAGGGLEAEQITAIQHLCGAWFKRTLTEPDIRQAYAHHVAANFGGFAFEGAETRASGPACRAAIRAAAQVALVDGPLSPAERQRLNALAARLAVSHSDLAAELADAEVQSRKPEAD